MIVTGYLSGAENSLPNLPLPLTYAGVTKRNGTPSYYQVVTPFDPDTLDGIEARPAGKLYLLINGQPWDWANQESTRYAIGAHSGSLTLTGQRQETNSSPTARTLPLAAVQRRNRDNAGRPVLELVPFAITGLKPGDPVTFDGGSYTAGVLETQIGAGTVTQRITLEAAP